MPYNGKSPTEINLAGMFGGAATGNLNESQVARLEGMAGGSGFGSTIAQNLLNKYQGNQTSTNFFKKYQGNPTSTNFFKKYQGNPTSTNAAPQAPSVVQTAGATNMGQRINTIESRLAALEGSGVSSNPASDVVPLADMGGAAMPTDIPATPQMPAVEEPIIPQSEQLGSLMASPFTMRQRTNMGPLNLNSPLNGNAFAKAVQDAKVSGASTFEVGGKTYNVK